MILRTFGWSFAVTALGLAFAAWQWGWEAFGIVLILSVLEISLSFDNAVVNAGVLKKMNAFWQKVFLTVGILVAVFGMRLVFPVVIVAVSAETGPVEAVRLALDEPARYEALVTDAHPAIAAFGGMFLLMIFLDFVFEDRDIKWLARLERPLARLGKVDMLSVCVALGALLVTATAFATHAHISTGHTDKSATVLLAGVAGLVTYLVVGGLSGYFESRLEDEESSPGDRPVSAVALAGKAAFFLFLYLEVLDASFSFDGVIGAFAVTNHIFWMALGLGIGAMYVRSLTVHLVRQGTLDDYVYLEHGAHYAIGALAGILLVTVRYEVNEIVTGLIGVLLIAASFVSSVRRNRALARGETEEVGAGV